jgi:hypothetical protein
MTGVARSASDRQNCTALVARVRINLLLGLKCFGNIVSVGGLTQTLAAFRTFACLTSI